MNIIADNYKIKSIDKQQFQVPGLSNFLTIDCQNNIASDSEQDFRYFSNSKWQVNQNPVPLYNICNHKHQNA